MKSWLDCLTSPRKAAALVYNRTPGFRGGTYEEMRTFGCGLGREVVRILASGQMTEITGAVSAGLVTGQIGTSKGRMPLALQKVVFGEQLCLLGVGAEVYQSYAGFSKKMSSVNKTWPVGLVNGVAGYLYPASVGPYRPYGVGLELRERYGMLEGDHERDVVAGLAALCAEPAHLKVSLNPVEQKRWQTEYAKANDKYGDEREWRLRMHGICGKPTVAVEALIGERWLGGIATLQLPMRGSDGQRVPGGKMEALAVENTARARLFNFACESVERTSVALSRAVIQASFDQGMKLIFGVPNAPAMIAHREAGHGILKLSMYRLWFFLGSTDGTNPWSPKTVLKLGVKRTQALLRSISRLAATLSLEVQETEKIPPELVQLDEHWNRLYPSVSICRDPDYLDYRYPNHSFLKLSARREDGSLAGYLIGQRAARRGAAVLLDFLVLPGKHSYATARALVYRYLEIVANNNVAKVTFQSAGDGALSRFQRSSLVLSGFLALPARSEWIVDAANGLETRSLTTNATWSISGLFFDH